MAYFQFTFNSRKIELEKHQIDDLPCSYRDTISQLILYRSGNGLFPYGFVEAINYISTHF